MPPKIYLWLCEISMAKLGNRGSATNDLLQIVFSIYLLKVNNKNTKARCEICSKLTIKTPEYVQQLVLLIYMM